MANETEFCLRSREGMRDVEERAARRQQAIDLVLKVEAGEPINPPWHDEFFQLAVVHRLRDRKRLEEAAHKLAIIKEVFGGGR